jgi:hypothetical protein
MFLLGNVGQQLDIEEMRQELHRLRSERRDSRDSARDTSAVDARLDALKRENDELRLYLAAVVRHLLDKKLLLRTELETLVEAIDGEDGTEDGRLTRPIR